MTTTNRLANDLDNILARTEQLWADLRGMHVFNPATGANLTLDGGADGPVVGGTTAGKPANKEFTDSKNDSSTMS